MTNRKISTFIILLCIALFAFYTYHIIAAESSNNKECNQMTASKQANRESIKLSLTKANTTYHIKKDYINKDTIFVPANCILSFEGGSISTPIVFNNTELKGKVKLQGAKISGTVTNQVFDASWLCYGDGVHDDATNINDIIGVCSHIYFPKGIYFLQALSNHCRSLSKQFIKSVESHIAINRSDICFTGEDGAILYTETPVVTMSVYSLPNNIDASISNITIDNLTFKTNNNTDNELHQYAHSIKVLGVNGLQITNCQFLNYWGDAISLSHFGDTPQTGERTRNSNVNILYNEIDGVSHNNRNGISVISGKNVIIADNTINNTSTSKMPGAIDIEANNSAYTVENIHVLHNRIKGCIGSGGAIGIASQNGAPAHNIFIADNIISNSRIGVGFIIRTEDCVSNIHVTRNIVEADTEPYHFAGQGTMRGLYFNSNKFRGKSKMPIGGKLNVESLIIR